MAEVFSSAVDRFDPAQVESSDHFAEKCDLLAGRFEQCDVELWARYLDRQTWKTGPGPNIDQTGGIAGRCLVNRRQHAPGIRKEASVNLFGVFDRGQIEPLIPCDEQIAIGCNLILLFGRKTVSGNRVR